MRLLSANARLFFCSVLLLVAGAATSDETDPAAIATSIAGKLSSTLRTYRSSAEALAQSEATRALARSAAAERTSQVLAELQFPDLEGITAARLLAADTRDPDDALTPPLSFSALSMVRNAAKTRKAPPAELLLPGSPQAHIAFVAPVFSDTDSGAADLLGFVQLCVTDSVLKSAFLKQVPDAVGAELKQGRFLIDSRGAKPAGAGRGSAPVSATTLSVIALSGKAPAQQNASGGSSPLLFGVVVLVFVGAGGIIVWRRRKQGNESEKQDDAVVIQGALKAIIDGAHPRLERLIPGLQGGEREPGEDTQPRTIVDEVEGLKFRVRADKASEEEQTDVPETPLDEKTAALMADAEEHAPLEKIAIPTSIFRSYDIRGIVDETLTEEGVYHIGRALGAEAGARDQQTVVVARDGRLSGPAMHAALTRGLRESGRDVLDIGLVPTPVLYFATHHLDTRSGVMITGSHNPANYNGLKIVLDGETLSGEAIQAIRRRVEEQDYTEGQGEQQSLDIVGEYLRRISEEIPVSLGSALKIVVDCGNGIPGVVAPEVLRAIGHDVIELYCEVDGHFPNHHPDPSQPENLADLITRVRDEGADLGLAFDGDGDRLGVVDGEGNILWPDQQMILFSRDILSRNPGATIIYDVKCSRLLAADIAENGGKPRMSKTGHSLIKSAMVEQGALLAGEMSGHIFFKERWYGFDDAIYSAARLLEILVSSGKSPAQLFAELPSAVATPELRIDMPEQEHAEFMRQLIRLAQFPDGKVSTLDGLRIDFQDSWGLIRPSNTTPCLVLRFEGVNDEALEDVKHKFRSLLSNVEASLELPF